MGSGTNPDVVAVATGLTLELERRVFVGNQFISVDGSEIPRPSTV